MEYGSSLVGIMVGVIFLFGVVYYVSSKQVARDAFNDCFDNIIAIINKKVKQVNASLDELDSRAGILDEGNLNSNESSKLIEDGYNTKN